MPFHKKKRVKSNKKNTTRTNVKQYYQIKNNVIIRVGKRQIQQYFTELFAGSTTRFFFVFVFFVSRDVNQLFTCSGRLTFASCLSGNTKSKTVYFEYDKTKATFVIQ